MQDKKYGAKLRKEFYMKNLFKLIGIIAMAAVIGFSFAACGDDDGTTGGNSGNGGNPVSGGNPGNGGGGTGGLNGTWVNQAGEVWVLNNGNLTVSNNDGEFIRGTYSTSGNNITVTFTQVKGSAFGEDGAEMGLSPNQWYTKPQFRTAVINYAVSEGMTQAKAAELADELLEEFPLFDPMTGPYTLSGNTLNIDGAVFTRQGGGGMIWTAVADSTIWYESTVTYNGTTYKMYSDINAVAYGGGRWVAVGEKGKIAYSDNGASWTAVTDSTFGTSEIRAVAYGNGRFVAVGDDGKMAYSDNGASWTAVSNGGGTWRAIAYGADKFVAVGFGMSYSTDGTSWTTVPSENRGGLSSINGITFANNKFIAVGNSGKMASSSDGTSWTAVGDSSFGDTSINAVAYGNNRWVAVGYWDDVGPNTNATIGTMAYSTDNGVTWTAVPRASTFNTAASIGAVAFGNNRFVAGCHLGYTAYSTDGVSWTTGSKIISGINGIAYSGSRFVAVGENVAVGKNDGPIAYCDW